VNRSLIPNGPMLKRRGDTGGTVADGFGHGKTAAGRERPPEGGLRT